jgi:methylenetetrahydrofolate reductase (NADPH)
MGEGVLATISEPATMTQPRFSFEFFPPKTDVGREKLKDVRRELNALKPAFFSMTYGAGGSTRDNTKGLVLEMKAEGLSIAPHLSFGGDDEAAMLELLNEYKSANVDRIVALRGDIPSGMGGMQLVYANELVAFIRTHFGNQFHLEVAAYPEIHPQSKSYDSDISFLKKKFDAGASSAITQYFFNADSYFYFRDACAKIGITQPLYVGLMPITNFTNLKRFSANCGADIPRWLTQKLDAYGDDIASITAFGTEFVTRLGQQLLAGGAPGIHFYTMNQVEPSRAIYQALVK